MAQLAPIEAEILFVPGFGTKRLQWKAGLAPQNNLNGHYPTHYKY